MSYPTTFIDEVPQAQYYFCRNDGCDWRCSQDGEYFKATDVAARPLAFLGDLYLGIILVA
jgi:hypothetical protein